MTTPLHRLREVEEADVLKQGRKAASLRRRVDAVAFTYDTAHLERHGPAVATTLPLRPDTVLTHAPGALPPFFSGLLPEGRRITALRAAVKTSADDELTMLLAVGSDTIGDVQVVPSGREPTRVDPRLVVSSWDEVRYDELFDVSVAGESRIDQVALPGVQDKVSARMIDVPIQHENESFILKLDPPEFPHLVANEAFFLDAARRSGLVSAEATVVHDATGASGLLVRRFDRPTESGSVMLAQEDACQVLGRYPADKYRVTTEEVVAALSAVCRARPVATLTLIEQFAFAYLTCNGDAHAKNFSVQELSDGEWRVTPAYDLPSTHPYGDTTMALPINGRDRENIGRGDFLALGESVGLRPRAVERVLDRLCERAALWIPDLASLPFDEHRRDKLRRAVEYRRKRLLAE
jgi:serine/threonine-protein kinase HipA